MRWIEADVADEAALAPVARRRARIGGRRRDRGGARRRRPAQALEALGAFRILCAHRRGPYGVASWTARIEGWLQPSDRGFAADERWYVGRPLLVTENDYELRLYNGDTGVVVRERRPRRGRVRARRRARASYSPTRLGAIETVYAMTIHKSQGSQFDAAAGPAARARLADPDPGAALHGGHPRPARG